MGDYRIRVRVKDGSARKYGKIKHDLGGGELQVWDAAGGREFVICVNTQDQIDSIRAILLKTGLDEIPGSTDLPPTTSASLKPSQPTGRERYAPQSSTAHQTTALPTSGKPDLKKKPYGFVTLPSTFSTSEPVWHDGSSSANRLSGEIRFEMENLTPLLVGWERQQIAATDDTVAAWNIPSNRDTQQDLQQFLQRAACQVHSDADDARRQRNVERARGEYIAKLRTQVVQVRIPGVGRTIASKSVLFPLRAPWDLGSVIIPGDSIKGLMRHELGALLGAPMERVSERSYSYRPNLKFPDDAKNRRLEPRLARVISSGSVRVDGVDYPAPSVVDILRMATRYESSYYPNRDIIEPPVGAEPYRGGMGGGMPLPDKVLTNDARRRLIHTNIDVGTIKVDVWKAQIGTARLTQYGRTLEHLLSDEHGHFSGRHPQVGSDKLAQAEGIRSLKAAALRAFQPGDLIWVEWDTRETRIVSFGWHYYYRWAYQDTIRRTRWQDPRTGLWSRPEELGDVPARLSPIRRLFGFTGDNSGSEGIGKDDHSQLMGRITVNAALELVASGETDEQRFLRPTFLRELGMPRPSAVEFYLKQPDYPSHPKQRPSDRGELITFGDATDYDQPGELCGRKFYLDRADAYTGTPWVDADAPEANRLNDRSTLALQASRPGRHFRFTVRFRDLDTNEIAVLLLAICPNQFRNAVGGKHEHGYCSKLGYARPLGWGTVRIEAKELLWLKDVSDSPSLQREPEVAAWFRQHFPNPPECLKEWLDVHRHKHPDAFDYQRSKRDGRIYSFHTELRSEHSRLRRYQKEDPK
jgi:hypothetical protein